MKLTTERLKKLIKEELNKLLKEQFSYDNMSDWIHLFTDEYDIEDINMAKRRVEKGRKSKEWFSRWVEKIAKEAGVKPLEQPKNEPPISSKQEEYEQYEIIRKAVDAAMRKDQSSFIKHMSDLGLSGKYHDKFANERIEKISQILNDQTIYAPHIKAIEYIRDLLRTRK